MTSLTYPNVYQQNMSILDKNISNFVSLRGKLDNQYYHVTKTQTLDQSYGICRAIWGTSGKKGLTQKEQIEVVRRFKEGGFNTLVATCVGEEGLDIGEVDLIVCYDVSKSPIRYLPC